MAVVMKVLRKNKSEKSVLSFKRLLALSLGTTLGTAFDFSCFTVKKPGFKKRQERHIAKRTVPNHAAAAAFNTSISGKAEWNSLTMMLTKPCIAGLG